MAAADLRDGDLWRGWRPLDVTCWTRVLVDAGLHLIPPDIRGRIRSGSSFRGRLSLTAAILAVVTTPSRGTAGGSDAGGARTTETLFP